MKQSLKRLRVLVVLMSVSTFSYAQIDLGTVLEAGIDDASKYLENYMEPALVGFGIGMNSGWYNTAKPHKVLGFDLSVSVSAVRVPDAKQFFEFRTSDYTNIFYNQGNGNVNVPTLFGPNLGANDLPELSFRDFDDLDNDGNTMEELVRISALTGLGLDESTLPFNAVPVPMAQVGIGLPKGFELKLRFLPEQNFDGDGGVKLFGIGLMHDISQWLPAEKLLPVDISLFAGYTSLQSFVTVDSDLNQTANLDVTALTFQAVASKKIAFLTAFAGVGYAKSDVDFSLLGSYETESQVFVDPVNFNYSNSGFRANAGLRIKLLFLTLTGEYTMQEYNTMTVGFGFSFR